MIGQCQICRLNRELSYEHVPPKSCFNDGSTRYYKGEQAISFHFGGRPRYTPFQRGHGNYTICRKCNSDTGSWYGKAYAEFIRLIDDYYDNMYDNNLIYYKYPIYPLRVVKQIISMMLSVNDFSDFPISDALRKFVLNQNERLNFNGAVKLYICIDRGNVSRFVGNAGVATLEGQFAQISDLSFYPVGITMCLEGDMPNNGMMDISHWAKKFEYNELVDLYLDLPILYSSTPYPGVYLSRKAFFDLQKKKV